MFARIGTFDVAPEKLVELLSHFQNHVVPAFSKHSGFLGYQAFTDQERGRFVGISLWNTRFELEASAVTAKQALHMASEIGSVAAGEPQILEMAFDSSSKNLGARDA